MFAGVINAEFYDCNARCYDPTPGRWLNQDPLGFDAGDTNLFRYHVPAEGQLLSEE
jgi:RHS repeat-associated protein